jgi:hypothetical protein
LGSAPRASWLAGCVVGGPAGLQRDRVGGQRPAAQRDGEPGDDVLAVHAAVQQQDLD